MADIGVVQWRNEYKEQFKHDFATHLTRILALDPLTSTAVPDERTRAILNRLTKEALDQGRVYIEEDYHPRFYNNELEKLYRGVFTDARIGGENCFIKLLGEYNDIGDEDVRMELDNITAQAVDIGEQASKVFLRMMVMVNVEGREYPMQKFSNAVQMLSFLKDAFEYWPGRNNEYFGVAYNRIIILMKHAQTEFMLHEVHKRSRMPENRLVDIPHFPVVTEEILTFTVEIISRMEYYLSFAILPHGPRLLGNNGRSLHWLVAELQHLTEGPMMMLELSERVKGLMSRYRDHEYYDDIQTFLNRMYTVQEAMWEDLLSEVQVVKSLAKVRLHVEAKIIKLHPKS